MDVEARNHSGCADAVTNGFQGVYAVGEVFVPKEMAAGVGEIAVIHHHCLEASCLGIGQVPVDIGKVKVPEFIIGIAVIGPAAAVYAPWQAVIFLHLLYAVQKVRRGAGYKRGALPSQEPDALFQAGPKG